LKQNLSYNAKGIHFSNNYIYFFSCKNESKKLAVLNVDTKKSTIIFEENFDENALDEAYWNYDLGNGCPNLCGWGNNERQIYTNLVYNAAYILYFYSMGKKATINISESVLELKKLLLKQKTLKTEKRVKSLIAIKSEQFETRQAISDYLGVHIRTLERWLNNYKSGGIINMLSDKPKNKASKIITSEIHQGLSQRVNDAHNPFLGYWDAQNWVKEHYNVDVKYQRIREYLIQHFKTKLKTPRKSHYKKDEHAEKAFLKTP